MTSNLERSVGPNGNSPVAPIDPAARDVLLLTDVGEVVKFAKETSGLEAAIRRSGKFVERYYEVARRMLWAEWHGGGLLRAIEPGKPGPKSSLQVGENSLDFIIKANKLSVGEAYRWISMAYAPQGEVLAYMDEREAAKQQLKRSDLVRLGKQHRPVETPPIGTGYRIIHADLSDADIAGDSVDVIITDPPYAREFIGEYEKLSAFAARVLKPGGSCLAMAGQTYLPGVIAALGKSLTYHWTIAYLLPGGQATQIFPRYINVGWKPVLWFVKGKFEGDWVGDVIKSDVNDNDKRFHWWGQSESGFSRLVERFSKPGEIVVDPFAGGGTTGVVALTIGRRFIGIDKDADAVHETLSRIGALTEAV